MAIILDGRKTSKEIKNEAAQKAAELKNKGIHPKLVVLLIGENPASNIYVRSKERACKKAGIISETRRFPDTVTQNEIIETILSLNSDKSVHGILVQLPLPKGFDEEAVIEAVDPVKDVDGFHPVNAGRLASGVTDNFFAPATPAGIIELLLRYDIETEGAHVVIVGRSSIVGRPLGMLFLRKTRGANATVTICHSGTRDLSAHCREADILIAAIGRPCFITGDMVKPGAVVVDVGINRIQDEESPKGYRVVGDVDFKSVSDNASAITPVPGGVGPMTIAMLLKNTIEAAFNSRSNKGV